MLLIIPTPTAVDPTRRMKITSTLHTASGASVRVMNEKDLLAIVDRAVDEFNGDLDELESAIGMLVFGRHYGWRVMLLIHSPNTIRNLLKILGIKACATYCPKWACSPTLNAWRLVDGTQNFWKVVRGQISGVRSARVNKGTPP